MNPGIEFLKRFFLFKAFSPDPQNPNIPLLQRVGKLKVGLLSIGPCGLKLASYSKAEGVHDVETFPMRLADDSHDIPILASLAKKTDCGLVSLVVGWKFGLVVDANKFKNEVELNIELGATPANVLGQKYQPGKRYMGLITPDSKYSAVTDVDEDAVQNIEDTLQTYNLRVMRSQIALGSMLKLFFSNPDMIPEDEKTIPLLHDNGHVVAVLRQGNRTAIRLFSGVVDPRPDNAPVERAARLTERLVAILRDQRVGMDTEFAVMDTGVPKIDQVMNTFISGTKHDAKLSWRPVELPHDAFEFQGLIID